MPTTGHPLFITLDRLRWAYWALSPKAAPGTDGVTWGAYGQDLEVNLADLHQRVHPGSFRATPSRRVYIPKADGRLRPLGIAALEDKIVQRAAVEVMNAMFEADFQNFSYGFRPRRGPHDALDALAVGIERRKVNWVLDADIRDFFTHVGRDWLMRFLRHRIADERLLPLAGKWLAAAAVEAGVGVGERAHHKAGCAQLNISRALWGSAVPILHGAVWELQRRFEPPLHTQQHPALRFGDPRVQALAGAHAPACSPSPASPTRAFAP